MHTCIRAERRLINVNDHLGLDMHSVCEKSSRRDALSNGIVGPAARGVLRFEVGMYEHRIANKRRLCQSYRRYVCVFPEDGLHGM